MQALLRDCVEVVDNGYLKLVEVARSVGMILAIVVWTGIRVPAGVPLMMMPLFIMAHRLYSVERTALTLRLKYFKAQGNMLAHADDVISNFAACAVLSIAS